MIIHLQASFAKISFPKLQRKKPYPSSYFMIIINVIASGIQVIQTIQKRKILYFACPCLPNTEFLLMNFSTEHSQGPTDQAKLSEVPRQENGYPTTTAYYLFSDSSHIKAPRYQGICHIEHASASILKKLCNLGSVIYFSPPAGFFCCCCCY